LIGDANSSVAVVMIGVLEEGVDSGVDVLIGGVDVKVKDGGIGPGGEIPEGTVSTGGDGVSVGGRNPEPEESHEAIPISITPVKLERILAKIDILGTTISFALTPPPNRPTRRAILPAIA